MDIEIETIYTVTLDHGDVRTLRATTRFIGSPDATFTAHAEKQGAIERTLRKDYPRY